MVVNDPIADMLTRIRNAQVARHDSVTIPASNMKKAIAKILLDEGYVKSIENVVDNERPAIKVTLRGARMEEFMDKLVSIALPRVRDFRGVSAKAFDGRGNYSLGIREQLLFPEIEYDKVEKIRGMEIVFVTTAKTDEECKELLSLLGMPFEQA